MCCTEAGVVAHSGSTTKFCLYFQINFLRTIQIVTDHILIDSYMQWRAFSAHIKGRPLVLLPLEASETSSCTSKKCAAFGIDHSSSPPNYWEVQRDDLPSGTQKKKRAFRIQKKAIVRIRYHIHH